MRRIETGATAALPRKARVIIIFLPSLSIPLAASTEMKHEITRLHFEAYLEGGQLQCPRHLQLAITEQRVGQVQPLLRFSLVVCGLG